MKNIYPHAKDGDYWITLANGNESLIYCHDMAGTPKDFITLSAGPEANYATYLKGDPRHTGQTFYRKVGIDLQVYMMNTSSL